MQPLISLTNKNISAVEYLIIQADMHYFAPFSVLSLEKAIRLNQRVECATFINGGADRS